MEDFMERVVQEKDGLDEKLNKLGEFLQTAMFDSLDEEEQGRLGRQFFAMEIYSDTLEARIDAFK